MSVTETLQRIFTQRIDKSIEKYRTNLMMRKEREDFLKKSRNVCHATGSIHRKLYNERFGKVYYFPARGSTTSGRNMGLFLELLESARDVEVR
jgi:hypothetical protein